eukprot:497602_1
MAQTVSNSNRLVWLLTCVQIAASIIPSLNGNDSGSFGVWKQDGDNNNNFYGLPYYRYTLDQVNDNTAIAYNESAIYGGKTYQDNARDHAFQFGNDRLTVVASNYGYIQVRMDETGPKFLNDYWPQMNQYGAGIGYLTNSNNKLISATYFNGSNEDFMISRSYSFYYRRYEIQSIYDSTVLEQILLTPFGDDPVIISKVIISNNNNSNSPLSYYEIYGGVMYQTVENNNIKQRRKYQWENYNISYQLINGGIIANYIFKGNPVNITNEPNGTLFDQTPPSVFISIIGNKTFKINYGCSSNKFYGNGNVTNPKFTISTNCNNVNDSSLIISISNITQQYNVIYILYGYIPNNSKYSMSELIDKYNNISLLNSLQQTTAKAYYDDAIKFNTTNYPEISREILWCYGMMRSSLSFYNLYNEYILDQGTYYRYESGFQGAFRDPLFHSLPFIYTDINKFKSIIRYSIKEIQPPFDNILKAKNLPYGLSGNGVIYGKYIETAYPSDLEIDLLWVVTEYILLTKDIDFLFEIIDLNVFIENNNINNNYTHTILDCLLNSFEYLFSYIGIGKHGIFRLQTMDLSDSFVELATRGIPGYNQTEIIKQAESGLNTPMLSYVLPKFYNILQTLKIDYPEIIQFANQQKNVLRNVLWNGQWVNRAWIPFNNSVEGTWLGSLEEGRMHSTPQSWTILSNALNTSQNMLLLKNINKNLRTTGFGATNLNIPYYNPNIQNEKNGTEANGGIWYSRNGPLILALSTLNATDAFEEWQQNSFANRANKFPLFWPNIWSSADVTISNLVNTTRYPKAVGTSNGPNFPILCTHSYSYPLYSFASGIMGVTSTKLNNIIIKPAIPKEVGSYIFNSTLIDINRDNSHNYFIVYKPKQYNIDSTVFEVILDLRVVENDIENRNKWIFTKQLHINKHQTTIYVDFVFD